jgi:hypothetical protein
MGANKAFTFNNVRFLFPAIVQPKAKYGGVGQEYGVVALIRKDDAAQISRFKAVYDELVAAEFKTAPGNLRPFTGQSDKAVLKDGDDKYATSPADKRANYEAYRGCMFINLAIDAEQGKIGAVDADQQEIISADQIPSGTFGHIVCECSCYRSPSYGPQFTVKPRLVQVIDISQPLGAPRMSKEDALRHLPNGGGSIGGPDINDLI